MEYGKKKPEKGQYTTPAIRPIKPGTKPVPESGKYTTPAIRPMKPMPKPGQVSTMPVGPIRPFNPGMGAKQAAIEEMRKRKRP